VSDITQRVTSFVVKGTSVGTNWLRLWHFHRSYVDLEILSPHQPADFDQRSATVSAVVCYIGSAVRLLPQCIPPHLIKDTHGLIADLL